jgi:hypothetical protein
MRVDSWSEKFSPGVIFRRLFGIWIVEDGINCLNSENSFEAKSRRYMHSGLVVVCVCWWVRVVTLWEICCCSAAQGVHDTKTIFTTNTASTYDWKAGQWMVPFNFMVRQFLRVGKLPVSLAVGARYYAEAPRTGPDWGLRSVITPLFTTTNTALHPVSNASSKSVD